MVLRAPAILALLVCASVAAGALAACSDAADDGMGGVTTPDERDATAGDGRSSDDGSSGDGASGNDAGSDADGGPQGALFAFVGSSDGKIRTYAVDTTTGGWTGERASNAGTNPSFLAFDPSRRRVLAINEVGGGGLVRSFAFEPDAGTLTEVGAGAAGGNGPAHVSLDPSGKWAFVANYTAGNMSVLPVEAGGALGVAADTKASGAMSHWAGTNPSGSHVFIPALGANVVAQYALDPTTGKLTANGTAALPANAGPRHLAFHPSEKWAYVINETAISVTTFDFDKATGKLTAKQTVSALPPGQSNVGVSGAEIVVHPSGKYVYASTRIYNSIAQFSVDATSGVLTRVANVPTGGNRPRSFGIDPEGTLLYAGNQDVGQVVGFRIDKATGGLSSLGKTVDVIGPAFVGLARIP